MSKDGGGAKRSFLLGTDYVYPRTTNEQGDAHAERAAVRVHCLKTGEGLAQVERFIVERGMLNGSAPGSNRALV